MTIRCPLRKSLPPEALLTTFSLRVERPFPATRTCSTFMVHMVSHQNTAFSIATPELANFLEGPTLLSNGPSTVEIQVRWIRDVCTPLPAPWR
jgi:hypothetical protein